MKKTSKQKGFKESSCCLIAFMCGFITSSAWCSLAKPQHLELCGYSELIATLKAGFCYRFNVLLHRQS